MKVCVIMEARMQILVECILFYKVAHPAACHCSRPQIYLQPVHTLTFWEKNLDLDPEE